jgi:hypothetical protein
MGPALRLELVRILFDGISIDANGGASACELLAARALARNESAPVIARLLDEASLAGSRPARQCLEHLYCGSW